MAHDPLLGRQLGDFRLVKHVTDGGFGALYVGQHILSPDFVVFVKTLLPRRAEAETEAARDWYKERFLNECSTLVRVKHEHIVNVHAFGIDEKDGLHYLVMERLDGETLAAHLDRVGRLEIPAVVTIVAQLADALQAAHDAGVVHRDVTPANVMLLKTKSGKIKVKLIDFGLAQNAHADGQKTRTGAVFGTIAYMACEQLKDSSRVSPQSDVFALAVLTFEMITGRLPWPPAVTPALQLEQQKTPPPPPPKKEMHPDICEVVFTGLASEPSERQQSVREFAMRLASKVRHGAQIVQRAAEDLCTNVPHDEMTLRGMSDRAQAEEKHLSPRLAVEAPSLRQLLADALPRKTPVLHDRVSERQVLSAHADGLEVTQNIRPHAPLHVAAEERTVEEPTVRDLIVQPSEWPKHSHHVDAPILVEPSPVDSRPPAERTTARPGDAQLEPVFAHRLPPERTTARPGDAQPSPPGERTARLGAARSAPVEGRPPEERTTARRGAAQPEPAPQTNQRRAAMFSIARPLPSERWSDGAPPAGHDDHTPDLDPVDAPPSNAVARRDPLTIGVLVAAGLVVVVCAALCAWALLLR